MPRIQRGAQVFRALRHRNYRLFFGGQLVSVIGTFLTNTAMLWLAVILTKNNQDDQAWLVGVVAFASQIPVFLLGPYAGVWVDRLDRRRLLIVTQALSMMQSFVLAALAFLNLINVPDVIALAFLQGIINSFDIPGRQAFVVEMVTDRDDLANAIALNSTMVHGARLIGPACAGLLIHYVGVGWCFLLDGMSYIAVISALVAMTLVSRPKRPRKSMRHELSEGLHFIIHFKPVRVLLVLMATFSLSGLPAMMVLMPIFGRHFGGYERGDQIYGFLSAASGFGALIGAISLARRKTVLGLGRLIGISSVVYGVAIAVFGLSRSLWLSLLIVPFTGWGMITNFASANTILQTLVDDDMRGRVMSFYSMAFMGMMPFGVLMVGALAKKLSFGADHTVGGSRTILIASGICLIAAARYWMALPELRKVVRPIYVERGILKEIADGLQAVTAPTETET